MIGLAEKLLRVRRRATIARSFTRLIARKPMDEFGVPGSAWRKELAGWRDRFAAARARSMTMVRDRYGKLARRG